MAEESKTSAPLPDTKAVAITDGGDNKPVISAKGYGWRAEKILNMAFAEGVKVRQDSELLEILDAFDVESPIPLEALHAVARILERVYAENKELAAMKAAQKFSDSVIHSQHPTAKGPA